MTFKERVSSVGKYLAYLPANLLAGIFEGLNEGSSVAKYIKKHKVEIGVAAWTSLALTVGVALFIFFWPGALAAVAAFPIAGFTLGGLVGSTTAQMLIISAVTYVATNAAIYIPAAIFNGVASLFKKGDTAESKAKNPSRYDAQDDDDTAQKSSQFAGLETGIKPTNNDDPLDGNDAEPNNHPDLFKANKGKKAEEVEEQQDNYTFGMQNAKN